MMKVQEGEKWINRHTVEEQNTQAVTGCCLSVQKKEMGIWIKMGWLLAHINPFRNPTLLTEHIAAPVEAAVTPFAACLFEDVVSSATAQRPATVHAGAALVADAPLRSQRIHCGLTITEVG